MSTAKTGALLGCAASIGAILAGAPPATVRALRDFGRHLGVAFQATDDLLGILGRPRHYGQTHRATTSASARSRCPSWPPWPPATTRPRNWTLCCSMPGQRRALPARRRRTAGPGGTAAVPPLRKARLTSTLAVPDWAPALLSPLSPGRDHPGHLAGGSVRGREWTAARAKAHLDAALGFAREGPSVGGTPSLAGGPRRVRGGARVVSLLADETGTARDEPGAIVSGRNGLGDGHLSGGGVGARGRANRQRARGRGPGHRAPEEAAVGRRLVERRARDQRHDGR